MNAQNQPSRILCGAAFLAALIPLHMPYQIMGLDLTGLLGAVLGRAPWAACLLGALLLHRGEGARPWWVLLSILVAFPVAVIKVWAYIVWSIGGFAP